MVAAVDSPCTGVVVALRDEACALLGHKPAPDTITPLGTLRVYLSGIGPQRAEQAASVLLQAGCQRLLSWGTAGALNAQLSAGDLLVPHKLVGENGIMLFADETWRVHLLSELGQSVSGGRLLGCSRVITDSQEKQQLHRSTGAEAVDMESLAVAQVAKQADVPFLCVRSVVDTPQLAVPDFAPLMVDEYGRTLPWASLQQILLHPGRLADLMALGRAFKTAITALQAVAPIIRGMDSHGTD